MQSAGLPQWNLENHQNFSYAKVWNDILQFGWLKKGLNNFTTSSVLRFQKRFPSPVARGVECLTDRRRRWAITIGVQLTGPSQVAVSVFVISSSWADFCLTTSPSRPSFRARHTLVLSKVAWIFVPAKVQPGTIHLPMSVSALADWADTRTNAAL